jgi:hypothetical protein
MKPEDRENYGCPTLRGVRRVGSTVHPSQPSFQLVSYTSPVPNRLHRYYGAGYLHFITSSCYQRRPLLASADRRNLFLEILERVRRRYAFVSGIRRDAGTLSSADQRAGARKSVDRYASAQTTLRPRRAQGMA